MQFALTGMLKRDIEVLDLGLGQRSWWHQNGPNCSVALPSSHVRSDPSLNWPVSPIGEFQDQADNECKQGKNCNVILRAYLALGPAGDHSLCGRMKDGRPHGICKSPRKSP
jgi:hypothetical protein